MTRIDCKVAAECGLKPTEYIAQFVHRDGDCILLAMDEEENGFTKLDVESAEFLARKLLAMVAAIRKCLTRNGHGAAPTASLDS